MEFDLFEYLESKDLNPKWATPEEIRCLCPFHDEEEHKPGRLYINTDNPNHPFHCFVCEENGNIHTLRKHFMDDPINTEAFTDSGMSQDLIYSIYTAATEYCHDLLLENDDKMTYLIEGRGLDAETILHFKLGYNDGSLCQHLLETFEKSDLISAGLLSKTNYDVFQDGIIIPYIKMGQTVQLRARMFNGNAKYKGISRVPTALFNPDTLLKHPEGQAVLVEGEFDAMVMHQMGFTCVALPGAQNWKEEWALYFRDHNVFLWLDQDNAGRAGAAKIQLRGMRVVEMDKYRDKDISDLYLMGRDSDWFQSVLDSVATKWVRSVQAAFDEWTEYDGNPDLEGVHLGYSLFDQQVETGFLPADLVVLLAATNAGKTMFLLNVAHNIRMNQPDKHILFISLEQTAGQWFERARRIHRFHELIQDPEANHNTTVKFWKDNFMIVDVNRMSEDSLYECVDEYGMIMGQKPDVVLVDYLGYYATGFPGDAAYARTTAAAKKLKEVAKSEKLIIFAPSQVNRSAKQGEQVSIDEARDSGVVGETADFVMSMWNPDAIKGNHGNDKSNRRKFVIDKSRRGPTGVDCELLFARNSLALVDNQMVESSPLINPYFRAVRENREYKGAEYEERFQRFLESMNEDVGPDQIGRDDIPEY